MGIEWVKVPVTLRLIVYHDLFWWEPTQHSNYKAKWMTQINRGQKALLSPHKRYSAKGNDEFSLYEGIKKSFSLKRPKNFGHSKKLQS